MSLASQFSRQIECVRLSLQDEVIRDDKTGEYDSELRFAAKIWTEFYVMADRVLCLWSVMFGAYSNKGFSDFDDDTSTLEGADIVMDVNSATDPLSVHIACAAHRTYLITSTLNGLKEVGGMDFASTKEVLESAAVAA